MNLRTPSVRSNESSKSGRIAVSITPASASKDSRSLKIAATLSRLGYDSLLFEGRDSRIPPELPGVTVIPSGRSAAANTSVSRSESASWLVKFGLCFTSKDATWIGAALGFLGYLGYFVGHYLVGGLRGIPRASIYYLHEYSYFPAVWIKARLYGAMLVYDAHDFYTEIEPEQDRARFTRLLYRFGRVVEKLCIREADAFVTVSDGLAQIYEKKYNRRPIVIHNAHDTRIDKKVVPSLRARIGVSNRTPTIVIVGQAKKGQRFSGILGALERLPEVHAAFIGGGYRGMIGQEVMKRGLSKNVHFLEDVSAQQVVPLIREADASFMIYYARSVNYKFALPNGFFQSIAAGLPLFYGDLPEVQKICRELNCGAKIDPEDTKSVCAALDQVINSGPEYLELKRSSEQAALTLSWENEEQKLVLRVLRTATGNPASERS